MFFTKIGKFIAHISLGLGVFRIVFAILIALGAENTEANNAAAREWLTAPSTGEAINEGLIYILVSVALGILCEISINVDNMDRRVVKPCE